MAQARAAEERESRRSGQRGLRNLREARVGERRLGEALVGPFRRKEGVSSGKGGRSPGERRRAWRARGGLSRRD